MKVCLVTAFPPSHGDLNEYGFQLASALNSDQRVQLVVLADRVASTETSDGFHVERTWTFNSLWNAVSIVRSVRRNRPDVVWFNMGFATFANKPVAAFLACMAPALVRLFGFYSHVTLHSLFEATDLQSAGVKFPAVYRIAGRVATRLLLGANDVAVLLRSYREVLLTKYTADPRRVHYRPHGTFQMAATSVSRRASRDRVVLAFGYWGTYKRLEILMEAMAEVMRAVPTAKLVIAGKSHPATPDYLDAVQREMSFSHEQVKFLGYVPEQDLSGLFSEADVLAMPYVTAAGASGVMHQACEYGLPIVAADVAELREVAENAKVAVEFYAPADKGALAQRLVRVLCSEELRESMANTNRLAAARYPMRAVVHEYLDQLRAALQLDNAQNGHRRAA